MADDYGKVYTTRKWRNARLHFLRQNPRCVMCGREGKTALAQVVDHIIPHKGDQALLWDRANWQPLCFSHHNSHKQSLEKGGKGRVAIGVDGWPL